MVGKYLPLEALNGIFPRVPTLGVVGPSKSGKTTLKNRIARLPDKGKRTQSLTAYIEPLATVPAQYLAILDGSGEAFAQQFEIASVADIICIVLDHNDSATEAVVSQDRLKENSEFLKQIRTYLVEKRQAPPGWVSILLNKRDLWENADNAAKASLLKFFDDEVRKWEQGAKGGTVSSGFYSNERAGDTADLVTRLADYTGKRP
jgi:hypothetical protein